MWPDHKADMVMWTYASLRMALFYVSAGNGFVYRLATCLPGLKVNIFFLELVAILCAVYHIATSPTPPKRLLIHTGSLNLVGCLNSLRVSESLHNGPLLAIAGIILRTSIDLCICYIPGKLTGRSPLPAAV